MPNWDEDPSRRKEPPFTKEQEERIREIIHDLLLEMGLRTPSAEEE